MLRQVFISYSTADTAIAEQIRDSLEAASILCWMAPRDIAPGQDYAEQIIDAIESCAVLLLVLSETSNHSQYVIKEVERAIAKRKVVIPFRIHNVTPSRSLEFFISNAQWIDAWQGAPEPHVVMLAAAIHNQIAPENDQRNDAPRLAAAGHSSGLDAQVAVRRQTNLPAQLTRTIGREDAIAEVTGLLVSARLLTLTGSGGAGKTRLAMAVGVAMLPAFAEGVWLVELAPLADGALVAQTVASRFDLALANRPPQSALIDYLQDRQLLLILDNCEHLIQATAELAELLLHSCVQLRILATSREALNIGGEAIWRVPPLDSVAAAQLFVERARATRPGFAPSEQETIRVAQICERLDGMPLAIELAAARLGALSLEQIAARLDDRFRLLTGGSRTALPRHRTLHALIDWSYELLTEGERKLLRCLSVFAGGWTLEAAEAVHGGRDTLDLLVELVNKSLVVVADNGQDSRYRLLETIQQYAQEKLAAAGELEVVCERHLRWHARLAQAAEPHLLGPQTQLWCARLEREIDNLRAALKWALDVREVEAAQQMAVALKNFWAIHGHLTEGQAWLRQLLAVKAQDPNRAQAQALRAAGTLAYAQGDYAAARRFAEESLAQFRPLGDNRGVADALCDLGNVAKDQGNLAAARKWYAESRSIFLELGNDHGLAKTLTQLGDVAKLQNDNAGAQAKYEDAMVIYRKLGDIHGLAHVLNDAGYLAIAQKDFARARTSTEEALAILLGTGNKQGIVYVLLNLGLLANLQGKDAEARKLFVECLTMLRELGDRQGIAYALSGLANVLGVEDTGAQAAQVQGAIRAWLKESGAVLEPVEQAEYDKTALLLRGSLGEVVYQQAFDAGMALPLEAAINLVLRQA